MTGLIKSNHEAWEILKSKGPVDIDGAQKKADRCLQIIKKVIDRYDYVELIDSRHETVELGVGRSQWDKLCTTMESKYNFKELLK